MPRRNAPENFFSAVWGCPRSCARINPGSAVEFWCAKPTRGSAVEHCRFLDTGGGGQLLLVACPLAPLCLILVTERYLWSFRPLTSQFSFCVFVLAASCAHVQ